MSNEVPGKIVTFYSYKGGVGRSMAVANIGVLLAQMDKKVLLIDWDLEAPGLEEYFHGIDCLPKQKAGGLLQLLENAPKFDSASFTPLITRYYIQGKHEISLLDSGHDAPSYRDRLAAFSWPDYFEEKGGGSYLEDLRNHWIENYDFILIDSRTGITDSGGVCTIQMPDILVLMFTANQQSLAGVLKVAQAVVSARPTLFNARLALPILPIPSRFDGRVEQAISDEWMERIAEEMGSYYEDWIAVGVPALRLIEQIKLPYIPRLSFGEELSVVTEGTSNPDRIGFFYRNVANLLISDFAAFSDSSELSEAILPVRPTADRSTAPRFTPSVSISSSFIDLQEHRTTLIRVINAQGLAATALEYLPANDTDISSSLDLLKGSAAYVAIIDHRYGYIPEDPRRNPDRLSITELQFNEASKLDLPIQIFIMSSDHPVRLRDVETDPAKLHKLSALRDRIMQTRPYTEFDSLSHFRERAIPAIAELRREIDERLGKSEEELRNSGVPEPPGLYAQPPYAGGHPFVGRQHELQVLNQWALPTDSHVMLLLESIGGGGKSMLAWEWLTRYATEVRKDWAGRIWYSFYEGGASMTEFCLHALAYITGHPLDALRKRMQSDLEADLLKHLYARPWLVVLDGLERVLAAYHRFDPIEEETAFNSDPGSTIRPEDGDFLRALAVVAPSKVLISSRLAPRALLNTSGLPIPSVLRLVLPGLRPEDAEVLLRSVGVTGDSQAMQDYLVGRLEGHPLVIGMVAGLVNDYLIDRGNFDAWVSSPVGGGQLDLASLDVRQRRNHILGAALYAIPDQSRQLLSKLASLSEPVDYSTLVALNADTLTSQELNTAVRDLERRGLLQYDRSGKRYGLHSVVRSIVAGALART